VPSWSPPGMTPVKFLEQLGVLDEQTLLVHAVHMTASDWEVVARHNCAICFCPRSNHYLNVGLPDIEKAQTLGLHLALGTDSLASNLDLDLFAEASFVCSNYSGISPAAILPMMTWGGARALGQAHRFGTLDPGKESDFLVVSVPSNCSTRELFDTVIHSGNKGDWRWSRHTSEN
jgi:aminodeoxyfutalosine deaminase